LQLISDVNIAVAVEAVQAIGNLSRGLRTHFSASSRFLLPVLLVISSILQTMYKGFINLIVLTIICYVQVKVHVYSFHLNATRSFSVLFKLVDQQNLLRL